MSKKIVIVHNIITPYKVALFNALNHLCKDFTVVFIANSENIRNWEFNMQELRFKYEILFNSNIEEINFTRLNFKLFRILSKIDPDVLIIDGYSYFYCWVAMVWGKFKKKKLILWSSSTYLDKKKSLTGEAFKKFFVSRFDAFNTYGYKSRNYLVSLGAKTERIFITGNVIDNDFYSYNCGLFKQEKEKIKKRYNFYSFNFLYVGRFSLEKNIFVLLEAYLDLKVSGKVKDWGLILVGSGPQEKEVSEFIIKNNLTDCIRMVGFSQKKEICQYYAVSDVLVLPSLSEPWGLVVNEAMASELAVVVSQNCGCVPDIVKDGVNGYSFDPNDAEKLKCLLLKFILKQVNLDDMKVNSTTIIKNYTPEMAAEVIKKTIEMA